jgi:hypothetical protein
MSAIVIIFGHLIAYAIKEANVTISKLVGQCIAIQAVSNLDQSIFTRINTANGVVGIAIVGI